MQGSSELAHIESICKDTPLYSTFVARRLQIASMDVYYLSFAERIQFAESFVAQSTQSRYSEYIILYSKKAQKLESTRLNKVSSKRKGFDE